MNHRTRLIVAVILFGVCVIRGFSTTTSSYSLSTTTVVGSAFIVVLTTSSNPPVLSNAHVHSIVGSHQQWSDEQWNRRDQLSFAASRTLQEVPADTDADTDANANANDQTSLPASGSSTLDGDPPTEENREIGESLDETTNDDGTFFIPMKNIVTEENTDDAKNADETTNDDIMVVVPMNIVMEQNTDDASSKREEDDSLLSQPMRASEDDTISDNRGLFGIGISAVGISVAGFLFFRRRQHSRWIRYRTHEILRAQDEAFDLGFRDEDELELPSFN